MAASPKKLIALDTNVMLEMAAGGEVAHEFRETFQARGYTLTIPPRVVAEMSFLARHGEATEKRLSNIALERLQAWDIKSFDLSSVSKAVAKRFAERLLGNGLVPEAELNDARILAETAVAQIPVLATFDRHLLDVEGTELKLAFDDADLPTVSVAHPGRLRRALR